jgi:signal transduction histidine kinase
MIRHIFVFLLLLLTASIGFTSPNPAPIDPVFLRADSVRLNLWRHVAWFKDANGTLTFDEVQQRGAFIPLSRELSEGFTPAAIWLRFDIAAIHPDPAHPVSSTWILETANALLDDVRLYSPQRDGSYLEQRSGEDIPRSSWPVDYRNPAFQLQIDGAEAQRFYLRIAARNALSTGILLWQPDAFASATRNEAFNYGIFYGVYILIFVFHLFFWMATRERIGGWYVPYVAINFFGAAISTGHLQKIVGLTGVQSDILLGVMLCLPLAISNTFTLLQLELASVMPRFVRIFQPLTWTIGIALSLLVIAGHFGTAVALAQVTILICIAVLVSIGIRLMLQGHRPARFFLFAFGFFYVAVVLRMLRNLGLLEPSLLTEYAVPVGALLHMVVMSLGITGQYNQIKREKLTAQAALNESLEAQVMERTASLVEEISRREISENEARHALDVMVRARQEQQDFVAMVSHEFRTPLAIINTVTQQLAGNLNAPREKSLERCADIRDSTRRMTDMMDEFLSYDRLGGEFHLNVCPINPRQLAHSVAEEFDSGRLRLDDDECLIDEILCDVELLRIALRNLIANALRHSPIDIPVRLITRSAPDDFVVFEVKDAGSGIPSDEIPRLFQKYFRGRGSLNKPGAGLGLYLVERIAGLHGGTVSVDSSAGQGTSFKLWIPTVSPGHQNHQ